MAFMAKILSWRFRHLNIVGCLLKRRPTKWGSRAPQDPPLATPLIIGILIDIVENSKSGIGCYKDWRVGLQIYNRYRNVDRRILIF